jgi:hypothetical protein
MEEKVNQNIYLNPVQMRSHLAYSNHEVLIAGRGMGKSEGIIAPRLIRWFQDMPRASIIAEAATYQQHFNRTLPGIFAGFEKWGWQRDRDYWVGKYAPDKLMIDKPFFKPLKPEYMIHTKTGACVVLVSQDRPGSANGLSAAAVFGDEAKYLKHDKHKNEVMPAIRGNAHIFGKAPCYGALLLTSDMPVSNSAQWLLDYGDENKNETLISAIIELQMHINDCAVRLQSPMLGFQQRKYLSDEISKWTKLANRLRAGDPDNDVAPSFFFHEAASWENIEVLRPSYFTRMKKDLSPLDYKTSILNQRVKQIDDGFYPHLSDDMHGYTMFNNGFFESLDYKFEEFKEPDCRQDLDVDLSDKLEIALDYGGNFNCLVVGQRHYNEFRLLKGFHCESPKKLRDVVLMFKKYYSRHKDKYVKFYYDHTAKQTNAVNEFNYYEEVIDVLRGPEYGSWIVEDVYLGATPSPQLRYEMWNRLLTNQLKISFKYNRINAEDWSVSCMLAPIKVTEKGYQKDKSSERDKKLIGKRERATHYSDAGDTLIYGSLYEYLQFEGNQFESLPR